MRRFQQKDGKSLGRTGEPPARGDERSGWDLKCHTLSGKGTQTHPRSDTHRDTRHSDTGTQRHTDTHRDTDTHAVPSADSPALSTVTPWSPRSPSQGRHWPEDPRPVLRDIHPDAIPCRAGSNHTAGVTGDVTYNYIH